MNLALRNNWNPRGRKAREGLSGVTTMAETWHGRNKNRKLGNKLRPDHEGSSMYAKEFRYDSRINTELLNIIKKKHEKL